MKYAIHITHEAVQKIGGIGAVISGACTADNYKSFYDRTLLYGPAFYSSSDLFSKLGRGGEVLYSNADYFDKGNYHEIFANIIDKYGIDIIYGKRMLANEFNINKTNEVDLLLVNINKMKQSFIDITKYVLWEKFQIQSDKYEDWDYEQYLRISVCYLEIIGALYPDGDLYHHFSHEYMGIPCCLQVLLDGNKYLSGKNKTIFWAHEISPARKVTESLEGHDIAFYNILKNARIQNLSMEDIFPQIMESYRTILVKQTVNFDGIFAVSDLVKEEYLFLNKNVDEKKVLVTYNGVSFQRIDWESKKASRAKILKYIESLYNFEFDVLLTHVGRLVISKGIWRDIKLLEFLDEYFYEKGLKGAYILLSSLIGTGRNSSDVKRMEAEYGWPVLHKNGWPDCIGYEETIYDHIQIFNAKSRAIKALFINQFGFDTRKCGQRVPLDATLFDLRVASDAEIGFSIYEPFGIAQLETLPYGSLALISRACGSSYLLEKIWDKEKNRPFVIVDFSDFTKKEYLNTTDEKSIEFLSAYEKYIKESNSLQPFLELDKEDRDTIEHFILKGEAKDIFEKLPKNDEDRKRLLDNIHEKTNLLSWESNLKIIF